MNRTVSDKHGNTVSLCNYSYTDYEGKTETCSAPQGCPICGGCSRLDGEHERGHCCGHLGISQFIVYPGSAAEAKQKASLTEVKRQKANRKKA